MEGRKLRASFRMGAAQLYIDSKCCASCPSYSYKTADYHIQLHSFLCWSSTVQFTCRRCLGSANYDSELRHTVIYRCKWRDTEYVFKDGCRYKHSSRWLYELDLERIDLARNRIVEGDAKPLLVS